MENQDPLVNPIQQESPASEAMRKKPVGFTVLLIFASVFNGLLLVLMLAGLVYHDVVLNILQQYYPQVYISPTTSLILTLVGALIFGVSVFGLILLWQYKRTGIYFYIPAQLIMLIVLVLVLKSYDYTNIGIAVVVMIIFGLYARDMNPGKKTSKSISS
jgi:hypothetical protein